MSNNDKKIRTRLAPSPTGYLHLGTARTAIFNELFTRKHGGSFVLRIEDTDTERSEQEYEQDIVDYLTWLGVEWDEGPDKGGNFGPYRQSERAERYAEVIRLLLEKNVAYRCFCSKEKLQQERESARERGEAPRYSGTCRTIDATESDKRARNNERYVIRAKVPNEEIVFEDIIRGEVSFDGELLGDFVIAKDEITALYNLAVVIDDFDMEITHVIRGEDHISNTPRQILLQKAIGAPPVIYAHLPLILGPDKSKMSKRKGLFNMSEFKKAGYLPEAMFNFLAFLGWHPEDDDKEVLTKDELIKEFDLGRVQKSGAIFNKDKLDWLNGEYIKQTDTNRLYQLLQPILQKKGWDTEEAFVSRIIDIEKTRIKKLSEFPEVTDFFFEDPDIDTSKINWKKNTDEETAEHLKHVLEILDTIEEETFTEQELQDTLMPYADEAGRGDVLWPLRYALSGKKASPGPFEIMGILGKKESVRRIKAAIEKLT